MEKAVFDIAVAGGGPAGIMAALHAARGGRSVCLIDRKKKIGVPVRCGEGMGLKGFTKSNSVRPEWIKSTIAKVKLVAPSGTTVSLPAGSDAYVIDRERMERDLTGEAVGAGLINLDEVRALLELLSDHGDQLAGIVGVGGIG